MMGFKDRNFSPLGHVSLEELVPDDNFYRRLHQRLDLSFVRDLVRDRYAASGRPGVDPEVFFKLQLVLFFENLRSERELMRVVADRLSIRWYLGYDLHERLPDHSSLTRIRERYGLQTFRYFFEEIVGWCVEAGLVWGEELYFDATQVEANAAEDSLVPRFAIEHHLRELFEEEGADLEGAPDPEERVLTEPPPAFSPTVLPTAGDEELARMNYSRHNWISSAGRQGSDTLVQTRRKKSDYTVSRTDPDSRLMHRKGGSHLGYHAQYVVDGGKARVILATLVTPADVMENQPMLDLLWHTIFSLPFNPGSNRVAYPSFGGDRSTGFNHGVIG